ncbi:phage terminase large subunit family protein [Paenibacillus piscarius]|uniref:phage terminase large subunit family protein n=1 Tax=Paenibacillus piscarius TaxID=1089681 RepID=UPI001EE9A722|nr:phage terminase large subunit family protein [Paenibacillus piscarius]
MIPAKLSKLVRGVAKLAAPPPDLTVSEWADAYRRLSPEASAEPGQWRTSRAPFQKDVMDAINDPQVQNIVMMFSAQVGKTEILLNAIGYFVDHDPAPIMLVQPTEQMAEAFSKDRLAPMIRDTPTLGKKIRDVKSKSSGNTLMHKKFPGGHITLAGSNAPASLASRPIRVVLLDEVDRYPASAGTEGDPVNLVSKRTTTFWNRKRIMVSTPTTKYASRIEFAYEESSMEQWCLPCPSCGEYQPFSWKQIHFEYDEEARITIKVDHACRTCGALHGEHEWKAGIGKWIARKENAKTRGFHLNEMASTFVSWKEIVHNFKEAVKGGKEMLKTWTNTALGETWEETGEKLDDEELYKRREDYGHEVDVPDSAVLLTAGIDTQDDRLEIEVVGWGAGKESWGIQYHTIHGKPDHPDTWLQLDAFLERKWLREDGSGVIIAAACIDSGGHHTTEVYKYCVKREHRRIYAIKGEGGPGKPIIIGSSRKNREKCLLIRVGVDAGKERITSNLQLEEEAPGYCHFPIAADKGYSQKYFKGLTSERKALRFTRGKPRYEWIKTTARNEPFDLRNYAVAALEIIQPIFEQALRTGAAPAPSSAKKPVSKKKYVKKQNIW